MSRKSRSRSTNTSSSTTTEIGSQLSANQGNVYGITGETVGSVTLTDRGAVDAAIVAATDIGEQALNTLNTISADVLEFAAGSNQENIEFTRAVNDNVLEFSAGAQQLNADFLGGIGDSVFDTVEKQINQQAVLNSEILEYTAGAIENNQNFTQELIGANATNVESILTFGSEQIDKSLEKVDDALEFTAGAFTEAVEANQTETADTTDKVLTFAGLSIAAVVGGLLYFRGSRA